MNLPPDAAPVVRRSRNRSFDLLRIVLAILVLLSHAYEITDGSPRRELFSNLTRSHITFGEFAVDGFFLLSGFLILKSWLLNPRLADFVKNRLLRIVPGFVVAFLLSTLFAGLVAPGVPAFFAKLGRHYLVSLLLMEAPQTPPVYPGLLPIGIVNGSLWTIPFELRCYLLVALFGVLGLLRWRTTWLLTTAAIFLAGFFPAGTPTHAWYLYLPTGVPYDAVRLALPFLIGGCFYLYRDEVKFKPWLAVLALLGFVLMAVFASNHLSPALSLAGGYLLFYFCSTAGPYLSGLPPFPDVSYGLYLYGWPVESYLVWRFHLPPLVTFFVSAVLCILLGWVSWHLVERPALTWKRRSTAVLPPA